MKKYKIKVFKHLLKSNQIAVKGEVVNESKFVNLKESLKGGFAEEVKDEKKAKAEKPEKEKKEPWKPAKK